MSEFEARESSNIHWCRYDEAARTMQIDFRGKDGAKTSTYEYADVPPEVFAEMESSDSKGRFFALKIRGSYRATKLWPK